MLKKLLAVAVILSVVGIVSADPIDVTINDGRWQGTGWYGNHEDNEVEPGMQTGQQWDLEKFLLKGKSLSIVGGYNFKEGCTSGGYNYRSGDIFIDVKGKGNLKGYDYAIVMDFTKPNSDGSFNYKLYGLDGDETYNPGKLPENGNNSSAPWKLATGGDLLGTGKFTFRELNLEEVKKLGLSTTDKHYTIEGFDLEFLSGEDLIFHYTMECGNDNLMGTSKIAVPEPGTLSMLIMGTLCMAGFWALRRKKEE